MAVQIALACVLGYALWPENLVAAAFAAVMLALVGGFPQAAARTDREAVMLGCIGQLVLFAVCMVVKP